MKGILNNVRKKVSHQQDMTGHIHYDRVRDNLEVQTIIPNQLQGIDGDHRDLNSNGTWSHSVQSSKKDSRLRDLPKLRDTPSSKRDAVFQQKLQLCSVMFDHSDPDADRHGMDMKLDTLNELKEYVNSPSGQKIYKEENIPSIMKMVQVNICRALPPGNDSLDPEEDEPFFEPSWLHLQLVYEFFLRFIVSNEVSAKMAKKYIDQQFCVEIINLFESEDMRERDFLKTILHRIYGKVMHHRGFIRRTIGCAFHRYVYETERHPGISELLEILGSIINGFAKPLKQEHIVFLKKALLPLHKPRGIKQYHQHLSYCIVQYVEKEPETVTPVIQAMCRWWPWTSSPKQLLFLSELEEILEVCSGSSQKALNDVIEPLVQILAKCVGSTHFQVAERSLFFWNNEQLVSSGGALSMSNAQILLPYLIGPAREHASGHWNTFVEGLAQNLLKMFIEHDPALFNRCSEELVHASDEKLAKRNEMERKWKALERKVAEARNGVERE